MATASPVQLSAVNARPTSHFTQFRGGTNASSSKATTSNPHALTSATATTSNATLVKPPDMASMEQASRPSSGQKVDKPPSIVPSRAVIGSNHNPNASSGVSHLELVELQSNALIEGVLGPNRDGRVRNPVPSKLKGKTDHKQGNFGVMHMGTSPGKKSDTQGKDSAAERDAAARRTSENTASRAKAAQQEKYIPPKKRGLDAGLSEIGSRASPFAVSKNDDRSRARPLAPDETKFEQARLLTLLRSINPITVVDQICKAIAYFGGIPGAPPPEDGIFPESANTRETGALFIGWIAEIFPDVATRSPDIPVKEPTGAARKKSRSSAAKKGAEVNEVEQPNSRNGYGYGPAVAAPAWSAASTMGVINTQPHATIDGAPGNSAIFREESNAGATMPKLGEPPNPQIQDTGGDASGKRRRGRPKGSTNKRGKESTDGEHVGNETDIGGADAAIDPVLQTSAEANSPVPAPYAAGYPNPMEQNSLQKPAQTYQYPLQSWSNPQKSQARQTDSQTDELSPQERAILEAFRHQGSDSSNTVASLATSAPPPAPVVSMIAQTSEPDVPSGKKRKRAPNKPKATVVNSPDVSSTISGPVAVMTDTAQGMQTMNNGQALNTPVMVHTSTAPGSWSTVDNQTPTILPTKKARARKSKAPTASTGSPARAQTASVLSSSTPTITASSIPEPQIVEPQPTQSHSRPPAEGLEAHYERFANLQQNGRSNTPNHPQHQRQQSKPGSVPPQQTTPRVAHQQVHMQQQKSQQGGMSVAQKDDQKLPQNSLTSRATPTNYFNPQRTQSTSFGQQYTPQASQLYSAHQASPQLNHSSTLNNTGTLTATTTLSNTTPISNTTSSGSTTATASNYSRPYSTNTINQASPQFSQHEHSYRTASPRAITQSTSSYSSNDNNFRVNSQALAQPNTSYSQPESAYRAPTTNSLALPSASYSSARNHNHTEGSHQNQYSHFSDSSFLDLPTLDSLSHNTHAGGTSGIGVNVGGYGQGMNMSQSTSRAGAGNSMYSSGSGISHSYDNNSSDMLRGVGRSSNHPNAGGYGTGQSDMGYFHKRV